MMHGDGLGYLSGRKVTAGPFKTCRAEHLPSDLKVANIKTKDPDTIVAEVVSKATRDTAPGFQSPHTDFIQPEQ